MKTITTSNWRPLRRALYTLLLCTAALWAMPRSAHAQLYVSQVGGSVGEYNAATGAVINANLIMGLPQPGALLLSGNDLFVANTGIGAGIDTVGEYNATTGAAINASLITGLFDPTALALSGNTLFVLNSNNTVVEYNGSTGATPSIALNGTEGTYGLAVSGNTLFVSNYNNGTVSEYNATTDAVINANFITGLNGPSSLLLSGNILFVANDDTAGAYNASTGAPINPGFITGLHDPIGLALSDNDLFVLNAGNNTVGEYNATTGAAINANLITGLAEATFNGIAVASVPEPSTWSMIAMGGVALLGSIHRKKHRIAHG